MKRVLDGTVFQRKSMRMNTRKIYFSEAVFGEVNR